MRRSSKFCPKSSVFFSSRFFSTSLCYDLLEFLLLPFQGWFPKFLFQTTRIKTRGARVKFSPRKDSDGVDPCGIWELPAQELNPGRQNPSLEHNGIDSSRNPPKCRNLERNFLFSAQFLCCAAVTAVGSSGIVGSGMDSG